jgi:hypothetical protein
MVSKNNKSKKSSIISSNEFSEIVKCLRKLGKSDGEIQATLGVLRFGKNPALHTITSETSSKWSQGHTVDLTISFSWLNIDDFIGALEAVTNLESPDEKVQLIKRIFTGQLGEEMTVGDIVKALEAEQKEREANSKGRKANNADWNRLLAIKELLFINFMHTYEPNPIFLWRAYTLCRWIQIPLPPGILGYLDDVGKRFSEIITEEAGTRNPFHYALGMDQGRGQSYLSDARLFDRKWQAQFHPENDIYINDDPIDNRTLQRYKKWMKEFTNSKLSDMILQPDQFLF